jgi:hypothetical protein
LVQVVDPARLLAVERVAAERRERIDVEHARIDDGVGEWHRHFGAEYLHVEAGARIGTFGHALEGGKAGDETRIDRAFRHALRIARKRRQRIPEEEVLDAANEGLVAAVEGDRHVHGRPRQSLDRRHRDARLLGRRLRRRRCRGRDARLGSPDRGEGDG